MTRADRSSSTATAWTATDLRSDPHQAPDKAQRVQAMFAAIAGHYDLNNRLHSFGRDQAWRRKAVALCGIQPTDDVLDVACGTGDLSLAFARARPRSVTGVDFTAEMLAIAGEKARNLAVGDDPRASSAAPVASPSFILGDAMNLPFADASFDVVAIAWGIRNVADPSRGLREFRRVLRSGGRLCVLEFSEPRNCIVRAMNRLYCRRIMPWSATLIAGDRSGAYRYLPQSVATFPEPPAFARLIEDAGFAPPQLHTLTLGVCTIYLASVAG